MKTCIIAEAASAHDGDLSKALRLVEVAADAGADACKFQFWSSADALADRRKSGPRYRDIYAKYQVPRAWLPRLQTACEARGLEFLCTVYLSADVEFISHYVQRFKIASFEVGDVVFLLQHALYKKPVIASLGMLDSDEFLALMRIQHDLRDVSYLQCTSSYPAPIESMNLATIRKYGLAGLSDHSASPFMGGLAVAAGARIVEVHARLDETDPQNPDYAVALSPDDLKLYVQVARVAERAMGDGIRRPHAAEGLMLGYKVRA